MFKHRSSSLVKVPAERRVLHPSVQRVLEMGSYDPVAQAAALREEAFEAHRASSTPECWARYADLRDAHQEAWRFWHGLEDQIAQAIELQAALWGVHPMEIRFRLLTAFGRWDRD